MESNFDPVRRLFLVREDDNGNFRSIEDLAVANSLGALDLFGGKPFTDNELAVRKYEMTITSHLQSKVDGLDESPLVILPQLSLERAERVIIYGPGHSTFPIKLSVTYTQL